jgi:hypothetical protein
VVAVVGVRARGPSISHWQLFECYLLGVVGADGSMGIQVSGQAAILVGLNRVIVKTLRGRVYGYVV